MRGGATATFVRPPSDLPAEPIQPLSKAAVKNRLETHRAAGGKTYLPAKTMRGTDIVWSNKNGQTVTTLDKIGPNSDPDVDDDIESTDVICLFRDSEREVSAESLMECLQEMAADQVLIVFGPDGHLLPDGRPSHTIYGVFGNVFTAEKTLTVQTLCRQWQS